MTRHNTRRAFLQRVGAASVIGFPSRVTDENSTSTVDTTVTAADLIIPGSAVPPGFQTAPTPDSNRFTDALAESTLDVANTDIAVQGYWSGETQSDPEWVLSSSAIVADEPLPRTTIETAAQQAYDEYVEAYNAETTSLIEFDQSHSHNDDVSDWRVDISQTSPLANTNEATQPIFTDRMRHQFFGNVVLGTIAFGPTDTEPPIDELLAEYATKQRIRYETHGATP
jgi:hypothetical protein